MMKTLLIFLLFWSCAQPTPSVETSSSDAAGGMDAKPFSHKLPWDASLGAGTFGCLGHAADSGINPGVTGNMPAYDFKNVGASSGMHVLATSDGTIRKTKSTNTTGASCFGKLPANECWDKANYVIISFPDNAPADFKGLEAVYYHLKSVNPALKEGDKVLQGTYLGVIGESGYATGVHLHYHVQANVAGNIWSEATAKFENFEEFKTSGMPNGLQSQNQGKTRAPCFNSGWFPTPASQNIEIAHQPGLAGDAEPIEPIAEPEAPAPDLPVPPLSKPLEPSVPIPPASLCYDYPDSILPAQLDLSQCHEGLVAEIGGKLPVLRKLMLATCFSRPNMGIPEIPASPADRPGGCDCLGWVWDLCNAFCQNKPTHINFTNCVEKRFPGFNADEINHCQ